MEIKNSKIWMVSLSVVVVIICIMAGTIYSSALFKIKYSNTDNINTLKFVNANNQLMLTGTYKNTVIYNNVSDSNKQYSFTTEKSIELYAISDKGICASYLEHKEDNLYFYDFFFQSFDGTYKNHINLSFQTKLNEYNFVIDNDFNIYITSYPNKDGILKFSKNGKLLSRINTGNNIEQLMFSNKKVYCVCGGKMYYVDNNSLKSISTSNKLVVPCTFTGNNVVYDTQGRLFELQNNTLKLIADFNAENVHCIKTNNYYLYCYKNSIRGNSIKNPDTTVYYNFDINISCAYYFNSNIYVGGYNGNQFYIYKITDKELISNESPKNSNTSKPNSNSKPNNSSNPNNNSSNSTVTNNNDNNPLKYSSNIYKFKKVNIIYNVDSKTSVTKFKKNINCNGTITIYNKSGDVKTSGNIGTGMTVVFAKGNEKAKFKIAVNGDLTGEGNVNSLDLNKMFNFLLEQVSLSDVEAVAGDLNGDNKITNKDLVLLDRLTN
ncbi:MAG: dockerin type I repeat-containing protein [Ruminococcus sp.]|nr:dockerin type I repeat-containing protein [Ruminococcus sp.]